MDYGHLPQELHFSHNFCFFLHDQLVAALQLGEEAKIFDVELISDQKISEGLTGESLFEWLDDNGHQSVILDMYYRQITAALLADMLHFLYEALRCSEKGKITVSFALLRKPLKENLFYLEWLLADPSDMLAAFKDDRPSAKSVRLLTDVRKKEIIRLAVEKTSMGHWLDSELIYDLRYNKRFSSGFEDLFQKANHLVTSFKALETEPANFNFVFSDDHARQSQWNGLYSYLPPLLLHAVEVVEALLATFSKRQEGIDLTQIRSAIGFAYWIDSGPHKHLGADALRNMKSALLSDELPCPSCNAQVFSSDESLITLYNENTVSCSSCGWSFDLNARSL
ncbi:hypothetical protein [Pseudoxanthomonas wuyuanensis]|uniref:Uncharacterized protein n=1 Tax=Pseudoxanthomonas wuyuanensis TaxID=1073196 RepID=A0A286D9K9_9GAMM|nr:hypothetical protein [Pseudoxanthomonas wuyuanensis]SOD55339.1 hypothetical protein SAMN06296416_10715 [Pseudoxanthomonas wuyuanensis]